MASLRRQEGYLQIDHRFSPGVSKQLLQKLGKPNVASCPEGSQFESSTITCSHCNAIVILNPDRSRPRNYCQRCDHYICDNPICNQECRPLRAVLDRLQNENSKLILV